MLIIDRLLVGGVRFVLGKVLAAADTELNDDSHLREELLAAQMRLELGELSAEEFTDTEGAILAQLRLIRERQRGAAGAEGGGDRHQGGALSSAQVRVSSIDFTGDRHEK